jgi:hypothetical protein
LFACLGGPLWEGKNGPLVGGLGLFHVMGLPSKHPMLPLLGLPHTVLKCHWSPSGAMEGDRCIVCMLGGGLFGRVGMAHQWWDMYCFMSWNSQASKPFSPCLVFLTQSQNVIGVPLVQWRGIDALFACLGGPLWEGRHGPLVVGHGLFHVMGLPSKQAILPMLGLPHTVLTSHWRPAGVILGVGCIVFMLGGGSLGG